MSGRNGRCSHQEHTDRHHAREEKSPRGTAARLASSGRTGDQIVEELYLSTLARMPTEREREIMSGLFRDSNGDVVAATEDALWTILNTKEFVFNH